MNAIAIEGQEYGGEDVDQLDIRMLRLLNKNGRTSFREIAKKLRVSLSTVSNRIHKMEERGIITGYAPIIDTESMGYDLQAVIGIRISKGKLLQVQKKIAKDKKVYGVYDVTGDWDSMVMARFRNRHELNDFIKEVLSMDFVERTYTQFVLNIVKDERRVLV